MAETTPAPATGASSNETVFTFEEQATASVALYSMSLFCIVLGGIRSARYIQKLISKKQLAEGSITLKEAKKFPLTASAVLFGLYLFFKPANERFLWIASVAQKLRVPDEYVKKINETIIATFTPATESLGFADRIRSKVNVPAFIDEKLDSTIEYFNFINKENVLWFLTFLICFEGITALATLLKPLFSKVIAYLVQNRSYLFSLKKSKEAMEEGDIENAPPKRTEFLFKLEVDRYDLFAILLVSPVLYLHINQSHWITNNIIGISFSIIGIEKLHLSSFKAGTLLLCGLFIYDIFWVFATDVMTSVAKGINAPILLQFPLDIYRNGVWESKKNSMLGLGDIVIPGIFIALLRRFDLHVVSNTKKEQRKSRHLFPITVVAYALGLLITMLVMHHFKAAQPALLYLVPCCLLIPLFAAACTGELSALWNYNEDHLVDNDENKKRVDSSKKTN